MNPIQISLGAPFYKLAIYNTTKENKMEKTASQIFNEAFIEELTKLAAQHKKEDDHEWADRVGKFVGLSLGVGLGVGLGNLAASRIGGIKDPNLKALAGVAGGAISGGLALSVLPKIQAKAKEVSDVVIHGRKKREE